MVSSAPMSFSDFLILKTVEHVTQMIPMDKTGAGVLGLVDHLEMFQHQMPHVNTKEPIAARLHSRYQGDGFHKQNLKLCNQKFLLDLKISISSTSQANYFKSFWRKFSIISV